jgi:ATP-dependent Clp protease adapter protein ClpS
MSHNKKKRPTVKRSAHYPKPADYQIIFYKDSPHVLGDEVEILSNIFGLSTENAFFIIQQAAMDGEALVFESTFEVIEAKVAIAKDKFAKMIKERSQLAAFSIGVKEAERNFTL